MENHIKLSACLVVYNEEKVIRKCLDSIRDLADEIIIVHDGACSDGTLVIAKEYTDKIFVRGHIGMMEGHLVFALCQAQGEWLLRIDADEYIDREDIAKIKAAMQAPQYDAIILKWEMFDGRQAVYFQGLQKMCVFKREKYHYCGIPHEAGRVDGAILKLNCFLRHRPSYNNLSWKIVNKKRKQWVPIHARYFFPEGLHIECFNSDLTDWKNYSSTIKNHIGFALAYYPLKNFLGQLKNGLWKSLVGINIALQQYVYYFALYLEIWKMKKSK